LLDERFPSIFTTGDVGSHTESLQPRDDNSSSSEYKDSQAPVPAATTSGASELATAAAASASDDCCDVCLMQPRAGFALVPRRNVRFCDSCVMRMSDVGCPVCRADMVYGVAYDIMSHLINNHHHLFLLPTLHHWRMKSFRH